MIEKQLQPLTAQSIPVKGYTDEVIVTNETGHALNITYGEQDARVFVRVMDAPLPSKAIEPLWNIPQEYK